MSQQWVARFGTFPLLRVLGGLKKVGAIHVNWTPLRYFLYHLFFFLKRGAFLVVTFSVSATKRFFFAFFFSTPKMPLKNRPRDAELARVVAQWRRRSRAKRCSVAELARKSKVSRHVMLRFVNDPRRKKCRKYCEGAELFAKRKDVPTAAKLHALSKHHSYRTVARMRQDVNQAKRASDRQKRIDNYVTASELAVYSLHGQQWNSYCASQKYW